MNIRYMMLPPKIHYVESDDKFHLVLLDHVHERTKGYISRKHYKHTNSFYSLVCQLDDWLGNINEIENHSVWHEMNGLGENIIRIKYKRFGEYLYKNIRVITNER